MGKKLLIALHATLIGDDKERNGAEDMLKKYSGTNLSAVFHADKYVRGKFVNGTTEINVENKVIDSPLSRGKWIEGIRNAASFCRPQIKSLRAEASEVSETHSFVLKADETETL